MPCFSLTSRDVSLVCAFSFSFQEVKLGLNPNAPRPPAMAEVRALAGGETLLQGLVGFAERWLRDECLAAFRDTRGAAVALNPFFEVRAGKKGNDPARAPPACVCSDAAAVGAWCGVLG